MPLVAWSPKTPASRTCVRADFVEVKVQALEIPRTDDLAKTTLVDAFLPFVFNCQRAAGSRAALQASWRAGTQGPAKFSSGADRSRTDDIQLAKLALYQLSYSPNPSWGVGSWWA